MEGIYGILLGMSCVLCGFYVGKDYWIKYAVIDILNFLSKEGYVKYKVMEDGKCELIKVK